MKELTQNEYELLKLIMELGDKKQFEEALRKLGLLQYEKPKLSKRKIQLA